MNLNTFKRKIRELKEDGFITDYSVIIGTGRSIQDPIVVSLIARKGMKTEMWKDIRKPGIVYQEIREL